MKEIVDKLTFAFFAENTIISFTSQLDEALTRKFQRVQQKVKGIKDRFIELNRVFQKISQDFQKNSEKLIEAVQGMENHEDSTGDQHPRFERHHRSNTYGRGRKGGAVVASKVQNLPNETNEATKQIEGKTIKIIESTQRSLENLEFMANLFETVGRTLQNMIQFMEKNVVLLARSKGHP